jgi:hypothetical protein
MIHTVFKRGGGRELCGEHIQELHNYVFDQIPNLQKCFTTPTKTEERRGLRQINTCRHCPFTGKFLRKADSKGS